MEVVAVAWARCRVIELKTLLLPRTVLNSSLVGVVEGAAVIFVNTWAGLFKIDLNSGRSKKVHKKKFFDKIIPNTSFCVLWRYKLALYLLIFLCMYIIHAFACIFRFLKNQNSKVSNVTCGFLNVDE